MAAHGSARVVEEAIAVIITADVHAALPQKMDLLVNIDVDDLEHAVRFYSQALGLRTGRRFGSFGVEMLGGTSPVYLLAKAAGSRPGHGIEQQRSYARHWTPVHLDFVVTDIDAAVSRAIQAGARQEGPISAQDWGRLARMADPFGHGFCFVQFLGQGYDAISDPPAQNRGAD